MALLFDYGGLEDIDWNAFNWDAVDWSNLTPAETTPAPTPAPTPKSMSEEILKMATGALPVDMQYDMNADGKITSADALAYLKQPVQQQQKEEIVSLASPFDADPFMPEAVAPQPTPAPAVQPKSTPAPVAQQQQQQQPDLSIIPSGGLISTEQIQYQPTIWNEEQQQFIPNPYLHPDVDPDNVRASVGTLQYLEDKAKYDSGELIKAPTGTTDRHLQRYYYQANEMIKEGVSKEIAQDWLDRGLETYEKHGNVYSEWFPLFEKETQEKNNIIKETQENKREQWFSELDSLKTDNVDLFAQKYNDIPYNDRLDYLYHLYNKKELTEDKYKELFKTTLNSAYDRELNPHGSIIIELEGQELLVDGYYVEGIGPPNSQQSDYSWLKRSAKLLDDSMYFPENTSSTESFFYVDKSQESVKAIEDIFEPSAWERFLTNPLTNIAASIIPGGQLVLTGLKAATPDVDIDPLQAAGGLLQGLQMTGTIRPPATLPEGVVGPTDAGTGLFGTTYGQTEALVNAVATGDIKETAVGMFGGDLVNEGLAQAGIEASNLGLTPEQLESSIDTTVMAVAQGNELDEALVRGFGQEVLEGVVGAIPETEVDFGVIEDTIKPIVETVIDTAETIAEPFIEVVKEAGPKVEDALRATGELVEPFVEPIIDVAETVGPEVEDVVRELGSTADDVLIQPVVEAAETVGPEIEDIIREVGSETEDIVKAVGGEVIEVVSPIGEAIEDIAKVTGSTVEDVLKGVGEIGEGVVETVGEAIEAGVETVDELLSPIGSAVEDIARVTGSTVEDVLKGVGEIGEDITKEIGDVGQEVIDALSPIGSALEDVVRTTGSNLEDLLKSLANMVSGAFGSLALQQQEQARQQRIQAAFDTRTTDSLFGDELFQFQTEIAISPEYLTPVQAIEPPEEFVDILGKQDKGLDYNYILEDLTKPRSYSF